MTFFQEKTTGYITYGTIKQGQNTWQNVTAPPNPGYYQKWMLTLNWESWNLYFIHSLYIPGKTWPSTAD